MIMHWATETFRFITHHWTDVGVAFYIADRVVKWTPITEDDEVLALLRRGFKKVFGKDPENIIQD